ncbi:MAG: MarR family transcriptional regulator [Actinobacteria bacterium]|nr:MarR family transcriptional regulator [Actinomycetota bacterium]
MLAQGRKHSTRTVLFHHVMAERLGLNPTDHKCMDIILEAGQVTAGQLAEITGLTTGAITAAVDRLEKAGFAERASDPKDRRKVLIRPHVEKCLEAAKLFEPHVPLWTEAYSHYSDEQLITILDFLNRTSQVLEELAARVRQEIGKK